MDLILIFFPLLLYVSANTNAPEIKIPQGLLKGSYVETWKGRKISSFTGIPYAKPPVGDFRFKSPLPADIWEGTFDATKETPICTQVDALLRDYEVTGQEDCLYLNVYIPEVNMSQVESKQLPVMFYIHGGGFSTGDTHLYAHDFLLDKDIVLVTIQYRLGPFGFISTGDEVVPGNNGLKDQHLALKWTKDNIKHFGGDPNRITVSGESAGAGSVHFHMISPLSKDLFSAAAFTSGNTLSPWSVSTKGETVKNTKKLAELLNCPTDVSEHMVQCLRKLDNEAIAVQEQHFMEWSFNPVIPFKPVIEPNLEGAFLSKDPYDIIKAGNASNVPILTGLATHEGAFITSVLYNNLTLIEELNEDFDRLAPIIFLYRETAPNVENVTKELRKFYFGDKQIDQSSIPSLTELFSDALFISGHDTTVQLHHKYNTKPIFYFLLGYRGTISLTDLFTTNPAFKNDVCHSDDLFYIFQYVRPYQNTTISDTDEKMIDLMVNFYTNFVITGNPTPKPEADDIVKINWEPVTTPDQEYLFIETPTKLSMQKNLLKERMDFWKNLKTDKRREDL